MKQVNDKLRLLYESNQNGLVDISTYDATHGLNLDGPCLMHCWDEYYLKAKVKILFVGKWPNGITDGAAMSIDECVNAHKDVTAKIVNRSTETSHFFRSVKKISSELNPNEILTPAFLWTNLYKYSLINGGTISNDAYVFINDRLKLLQSEIVISKADVVIFFTGHKLDGVIKTQFDQEVEFKNVSGFPIKDVAQVVHPSLPVKSFRVCHPQYDDYSKVLIDLIKSG